MRTGIAPVIVGSVVLCLGCSHEGRGLEDGFGTGAGSTPTGAGSDAGSEGDAGDETGGTDGTDSGAADDGDGLNPPTKFDIGAPEPPTDEPAPEPCKKVDMVFVIDNSGSMAGEQQNLVDSFPGFVEEIQTTLASVDSLHIGAVTTDIHAQNPPDCQKLGAFVQASAVHGTCTPFDSGSSWMTENQLDLEGKFTCAGQNGTGGSGDEKPMDAVRLAISDSNNGPGGCNEGFLRDDALLVTVFITDEEDDNDGGTGNSQGDPPDWFDGVVAAKHGTESNVVVLSLVGHEQPNECDGIGLISTDESAEFAPRIHEFTNMFTYGFLGDVCADTYQPFFHDAISVIDQACTSFTPPS